MPAILHFLIFLLFLPFSLLLGEELLPFEENLYRPYSFSEGGVNLYKGSFDPEKNLLDPDWEKELKTEYYVIGENEIFGETVYLSTGDFRVGKVKRQVIESQSGLLGEFVKKHQTYVEFGYEILGKERKTTVRDSLGKTEVFTFDPKGRLIKKEDLLNDGEGEYKVYRSFSYQWFDEGKLKNTFLKNEEGRILWHHEFVFDQIGRQIQHVFRGNLSGQNYQSLSIDPITGAYLSGGEAYFHHRAYLDGGKTELEWTKPEVITRKKFDDQGKHLATFIEVGQKVVERTFFSYDSNSRLVETVTDDGSSYDLSDLQGVSFRKILSYELDSQGQILSEKLSYLCLQTGKILPFSTKFFSYNSFGDVICEELYNDKGVCFEKKEYAFDDRGRLIHETTPSGNNVSYEYDKRGRLKRKIDEAFGATRFEYNSLGQVVSEVQTCEGQGGRKIYFDYDLNGNLLRKTNYQGHEETFIYDVFGRCVKAFPIPSEKGKQAPIRYYYNELDQVSKKKDQEGYQTYYLYNSRGEIAEILFPDGTYETRVYNIDGSLAQIKQREGLVTNYSYDPRGRLVRKFTFSFEQENYEDDRFVWEGLFIKEETNLHGVVTDNCYNEKGELAQKLVKKAGGQVLVKSFEWDILGRLIEETLEDAESGEGFRTEREYDLGGNLKRERVFTLAGALIGQETFNYNIQGKLIKKSTLVNEGKEASEVFEYDAWGREVKRHDSDGKGEVTFWDDNYFTSYGYTGTRKITYRLNGESEEAILTPNGMIKSLKSYNRFGQGVASTVFVYDKLGLCVKELKGALSNDFEEPKKEISYVFGPMGRLLSVVEQEGRSDQKATHYLHNQYGRIAEVHLPRGGVLFYEYNGLGQVTSLSSSLGDIDYQYAYNEAHQIARVDNRKSGKSTFKSYCEDSLLQEEILENGFCISYEYDAFGRVTSLAYPDGSKVIYAYEGSEISQAKRVSAQGNERYVQTLERDLRGNILSKTLPGFEGNVVYERSRMGNCLKIRSPFWSSETIFGKEGAPRIYQSDVAGRYEPKTLLPDPPPFSISKPGGAFSLEGDVYVKRDTLDRVIEIYKSRFAKIELDYDPFGRVIEKRGFAWKSGGWEKETSDLFIWDQERLLGLCNPQGELTHSLIYSDHQLSLMALEIKGAAYAVVQDEAGGIVAVADLLKKRFVESYRYLGGGVREVYNAKKQKRHTSQVGNPFSYCLGCLEKQTGLLIFKGGLYDPYIGKMVTEMENRWALGDQFELEEGTQLWGILPFFESSWFLTLRSTVDTFQSSFNSLYNKLGNFFIGKLGFRSISTELTQYAYEKAALLSTKYIGSDFLLRSGLLPNYFSIGTVGSGEIHPQVRITLINGILNSTQSCEDTAHMISSTHGGVNVHYIYNPTGGFAQDILKAFIGKLGFRTYHSKVLAMQWKKLIREMGGPEGGGVIYHYAHSLGGTLTYNARAFLTLEERKMIKVITIGSPTAISKGFGSATNYSSRLDLIPLFDPFKYFQSLFRETQNIVFTSAANGGLLSEHLLTGETYRNLMESLGETFIQEYGT